MHATLNQHTHSRAAAADRFSHTYDQGHRTTFPTATNNRPIVPKTTTVNEYELRNDPMSIDDCAISETTGQFVHKYSSVSPAMALFRPSRHIQKAIVGYIAGYASTSRTCETSGSLCIDLATTLPGLRYILPQRCFVGVVEESPPLLSVGLCYGIVPPLCRPVSLFQMNRARGCIVQRRGHRWTRLIANERWKRRRTTATVAAAIWQEWCGVGHRDNG